MIAYLILLVTFLNCSILGIHIGQVHHLLNVLAGTMSERTTPNPIKLIRDVANSSGVDYAEMVKIASLVCEHDIGLDLLTGDGCTVIEEIAAHFLASMGTSISAQGSLGRSLSQFHYQLQNERYYYPQYHDVFPLVCTYARNMNFPWRYEVASRISSTRFACDMLDRTVEQYIGHFNPRDFEKMLFKNSGIFYPDMPHIQVTYKQIGMMIPRKCEQMASIYPRNSVPRVCTLLPRKTLNLLIEMSDRLRWNPGMDIGNLMDLMNSDHEFKIFHARHYIQKICREAEDKGSMQIKPACDLILIEHPEVMIPPAD